jgi:hypothetical protein
MFHGAPFLELAEHKQDAIYKVNKLSPNVLYVIFLVNREV